MQRGISNKKEHKIKYLILQFYENCKIYEISQIPTRFNAFYMLLKQCTFMPEDGRIDRNM
jgi:hypothetical protein